MPTDGNNYGKERDVKKLADGRFSCGICHKIFKHRQSVFRHIELFHASNKEKLIHCQYPGCKSKFRFEEYLKTHIQRMHNKSSALPNVPKAEPYEKPLEQSNDEIPNDQDEIQKFGDGMFSCGICSKIF